MKKSFTPQEVRWILYDVGNSAFTLLVATILPIYFDYLAKQGGLDEVQYLAWWGYAASIATGMVLLLGPITGTLSDAKDRKKPLFLAAILIGAIGCLAMGFAKQWAIFLIIFIIAKVGYSISLIIYDSMLSDITTEERMDNVSSAGYAWGYIGSCLPFLVCLGLVLGADRLGLTLSSAMMISFAIIAIWWVGVSTPLLKYYKQLHYVEVTGKTGASDLKRLAHSLKEISRNKQIFLFIAAFFFYIDGVYTIIEMATAYGKALGLDTTGLLLALLVTQIVAFPSSIIIGKLSGKFPSENLITVCILAYFGIAVFAMFMSTQLHFWILAVVVGMFQGGIQALSRSYFTKIIPPEKSGEYFGILDICGKGASFMGTIVISVISQLTGNVSAGVGSLSVFFLIGLVLFRMSAKAKPAA